METELHPGRGPGAESAFAEPEKFIDYLLNEEHPHSKGKAKFLTAIGYDVSQWEELRDQSYSR